MNQIAWDEERAYASMGAVAVETSTLCRDRSGQKWAGVFLPRGGAVAERRRTIGCRFPATIWPTWRRCSRGTAAAFELRRARRGEAGEVIG
ncbi:MAG: hypothetical protein IPJ41_08245 [Phycisphaerales bacterium]|nr:hypothetical protein [Phycisphaerales bacterium]